MRKLASIKRIDEIQPGADQVEKILMLNENTPMQLIKIGDRFYRLTVLSLFGRDKHRTLIYKCLCDCGKISYVRSSALRRGLIKSCGCYHREVISQIAKKFNPRKAIKRVVDFKFKHGIFEIGSCYNLCDKTFIYKITNLINGKLYIGQTNGTLKELIQRYNREVVVNSNRAIIHAINKYGMANFKLEIIEKLETSEVLNKKEEFYISLYKSMKHGYNITSGGDGVRGYKRSKEAVKKMRMSLIGKFVGKRNPFFGKTHSEETRRKIAESNRRRTGEKRKPLTEAHKKKILETKRRKILEKASSN